MLGLLAESARVQGVELFIAEVLPGNHRMLRVFRDSGFSVRTRSLPGVIMAEMPTELTPDALRRFEDREERASAAAMRRVLAPRSVAVIGASRRRGTVGGELFHNLLAAGFAGPVYPVNPKATSVQSVAAYPTVDEVPGPVDLAVLAVPAAAVVPVARACAAKGVGALVVLSAGFAESGPEGVERQRDLLAVCRQAGMRLVGPNCLGVINTNPAVGLDATFGPTLPARGRVGFGSQSGALGLAIVDYANVLRLGLSSFVAMGNNAAGAGRAAGGDRHQRGRAGHPLRRCLRGRGAPGPRLLREAAVPPGGGAARRGRRWQPGGPAGRRAPRAVRPGARAGDRLRRGGRRDRHPRPATGQRSRHRRGGGGRPAGRRERAGGGDDAERVHALRRHSGAAPRRCPLDPLLPVPGGGGQGAGPRRGPGRVAAPPPGSGADPAGDPAGGGRRAAGRRAGDRAALADRRGGRQAARQLRSAAGPLAPRPDPGGGRRAGLPARWQGRPQGGRPWPAAQDRGRRRASRPAGTIGGDARGGQPDPGAGGRRAAAGGVPAPANVRRRRAAVGGGGPRAALRPGRGGRRRRHQRRAARRRRRAAGAPDRPGRLRGAAAAQDLRAAGRLAWLANGRPGGPPGPAPTGRPAGRQPPRDRRAGLQPGDRRPRRCHHRRRAHPGRAPTPLTAAERPPPMTLSLAEAGAAEAARVLESLGSSPTGCWSAPLDGTPPSSAGSWPSSGRSARQGLVLPAEGRRRAPDRGASQAGRAHRAERRALEPSRHAVTGVSSAGGTVRAW